MLQHANHGLLGVFRRPFVFVPYTWAAFAGAVFLGTCNAIQLRVYYWYIRDPIPWTAAFVTGLSFWITLFALTIPIAYATRWFPLTRKRIGNWILLMVCGALFPPVHSLLFFLLIHGLLAADPATFVPRYLISGYTRGVAYYWLILTAFYAIDGVQRTARLETQLVRAQLQALKVQLQPHFLFNTLNSISALLHQDSKAADDMIQRLGDFLRRTLTNSDVDKVCLREELDLLDTYVGIERVRFQQELRVIFEVSAEVLAAHVPSLILQPIVENAIHHGVGRRPETGRIDIRAGRRGEQLHIEVEDEGPGMARGAKSQKLARTGLGLSNTMNRLRQTYGDRSGLELTNTATGGCLVRMVLPFETDGRRPR